MPLLVGERLVDLVMHKLFGRPLWTISYPGEHSLQETARFQ
jgi:hypothetical protein